MSRPGSGRRVGRRRGGFAGKAVHNDDIAGAECTAMVNCTCSHPQTLDECEFGVATECINHYASSLTARGHLDLDEAKVSTGRSWLA